MTATVAIAAFILGANVGAIAALVLVFYREQKRHPEPSSELMHVPDFVPDEWVQS